MLPFVSFRLGNLLKILMQNFLNKTFTFLFITLMGCESIIDIFPPELEIIKPQTDEVIYDDIIIAGTATDNNTVTEIKIYTQTKLGDTWLEEKITDGNDIEVSFPVWSRSIDHILVKAFDDVNNFDHIKIKINQTSFYFSPPQFTREHMQIFLLQLKEGLMENKKLYLCPQLNFLHC